MPAIRILSETDLRAAVQLDLEAVACVEDAFRALAGGEVVMPPILSLAIAAHNGEVDVKTAFVPGLDSFAIKISPGFFDNPSLGLPSTSGLMILFAAPNRRGGSAPPGQWLSDRCSHRRGGAVAARHLSRENAENACIVGTGMQARLQLTALCLVRPIRSATIWGRDP